MVCTKSAQEKVGRRSPRLRPRLSMERRSRGEKSPLKGPTAGECERVEVLVAEGRMRRGR